MKIENMKVLVTGGASGMGRCFVNSLSRDGADVAFCDLNADAIAAVEAECAGNPGTVKGFVANVAVEADVAACLIRLRAGLTRANTQLRAVDEILNQPRGAS